MYSYLGKQTKSADLTCLLNLFDLRSLTNNNKDYDTVSYLDTLKLYFRATQTAFLHYNFEILNVLSKM